MREIPSLKSFTKMILALSSGEYVYVDLGDGASAKILKTENTYQLFEIPIYGGYPTPVKKYPLTIEVVKEILHELSSWT